MYRYIITYRLERNETYDERRNALRSYCTPDTTTSTLFLDSSLDFYEIGKMLIEKCNLLKTDNILSIQVLEGKIEAIYRIEKKEVIEEEVLILTFY